MFRPNRAWHNRPNRIEDVPRTLWRSMLFAVLLQLIGMPTNPLLLHATKLPTDAWLLPKSCSTGWALAAGHARSGIVLPGFRILKSVWPRKASDTSWNTRWCLQSERCSSDSDIFPVQDIHGIPWIWPLCPSVFRKVQRLRRSSWRYL